MTLCAASVLGIKTKIFQIQTIAQRTRDFVSVCQQLQHLRTKPSAHTTEDHHNCSAQALSRTIYTAANACDTGTITGQNLSANTIVTTINATPYVIPPNCRFNGANMADLESHVTGLYDFVVIDPPWSNKYVKRAKQMSCG